MRKPNVMPTKVSVWGVVALLTALGAVWGMGTGVRSATAQASNTLPEGRDFATLQLRDPWDMSQFSDVSQYLNSSGQAQNLQDIKVEDGIFSATSTSSKDAQFFTLWPGYNTAMLIGKVGHQYPVDSNVYSCLYLGMKVNSKAADSGGPDQFQVMWFADELLNGAGGAWGYSKAFPVYPEAGSGAPTATWKLFKIDLAASANHSGGTRWTDRDSWQGIRIDPTIQADVRFEVDWVRLTDCKAVTQSISWSGSQTASIWLRPEGSQRDFLVANNLQGSSYSLDVQGLPPGSYEYSVKSGSKVLASGGFEVNQTPIIRFPGLSPADGTDYAKQAGNPWDFTDSTDAVALYDMSTSFSDGILDMVTPGGGGMDAIIELNSPREIPNSRDYQYLAFRIYTEAAWQNVPQGMIARWIWTIPGSGSSKSECVLVSQDIPLDVGWNTYFIDLSDEFNGLAEEVAGKCEGLPRHWMDTSPVIKFRFDPNENILSGSLHQKLDWIRLIKVKQITQGQLFPVQASLSESPEELESIKFYYTDDPSKPTQHPATGQANADQQAAPQAAAVEPASPGAWQARNRIFIPFIYRNFYELEFPPVDNGVNFTWNTASVPVGNYYLCAVAEDGYNQATFCSEAVVKIVKP